MTSHQRSDQSRLPSWYMPEASARIVEGPKGAFDADGTMTIDAIQGETSVGLNVAELTPRHGLWTGARPTDYASGSLWEYARLVGDARDGKVTHLGAAAETNDFMDH